MRRQGFKTIVASLLAGLLGICSSGAFAVDAECMSVPEMRERLEAEQYGGQMKATQLTIDESKRAEWLASKHTTFEGGATVTGAELDVILGRITDRNRIYDVKETLRKNGQLFIVGERQMAELSAYASRKLTDRRDMLAKDRQGFNLYTSGTKALVVMQRQNKACVTALLQDAVVQHYESGDLPPWLAPTSKLRAAIQQYRIKKGFGLAAFGRNAAGETLVVVARPSLGPGRQDGPVPNLTTGAVLAELANKDVVLIGELTDTLYTENHGNNFPKPKL